MWLYVTESSAEAERILADILVPMLTGLSRSCARTCQSARPRSAPRSSQRGRRLARNEYSYGRSRTSAGNSKSSAAA